MSELHYLNHGGMLMRAGGMLAWRCPDCGAFGKSKDVLKACPECRKREGKSGRFGLRMPKSLHVRLAAEAKAEGVSLNAWIVSLLSRSKR